MRTISGLWRWRHNPLRRATDLAEAWLALAGLVLILVLAPLAGVLVGGATEDALQRSAREQQAARHRVTATVVREVKHSPLDVDPESASGGAVRSRVIAAWRGPDGSRHEGPVVAGGARPHRGGHFPMWTDAHGGPVARPLDPAAATVHAVLAAAGTALAAAALVETARRVALWRMVRRRHARLDREWERAGPDWGRTGAGS
ncbi:hypothetical protein [Streptomyces sp. NPDC003717]|uniref:Rv1733c family protein n=1 Tax=Streptomyces sp. NPDC003717 TaxID=3154276 RepID=UPI0033A9B037